MNTAPQARVAQFKKAFLERLYFSEVSSEKRDIEIKMRLRFNEMVRTNQTEDICLKYKRYSEVNPVKLRLTATGPFIFNVIPDLPLFDLRGGIKTGDTLVIASQKSLISFHSGSIPTVEQAVKRIGKSLTIRNQNFKYVEDQENLDALKKILDYAKSVSAAAISMYEEAEAEALVKYKELFEASSGITLDDLSEVFFDYSADKYREFFTSRGFTMPSEITFPEHSHEDCAHWVSAFPLNGWELTRQPDGYGHECGSSVSIDWVKKALSVYGWSSDD